MSTQSLLSHKKMGLDKNVWLVLLVTILLCFGLISYNVIEDKSCVPFAISVRSLTDNNSPYDVGETLIFKTSLPEGKELLWSFGDNTPKVKSGDVNMRHKFFAAGTFTVSAQIGGKCVNEIILNVVKTQNTVTVAQTSNVKAPKIYGALSPSAGKAERYISDAVGNSYEWKVLDRPGFPVIADQYAVVTFPKPGVYVLQLTVDHDRKKRSEMEIHVSEDLTPKKAKAERPGVLIPFDIRPPKSDKKEDKSAEKQAEKPAEVVVQPDKPAAPSVDASAHKVLFIHNQSFQTLLEGVVAGQKDLEDFDQYLVDGGNTKVLVNNGNNYKSFKQLCQDIHGKKIVIESVDLKRDETDKTRVMQIMVNYKKKGFRIF